MRATYKLPKATYRSLALVCLLMAHLSGASGDPYERTPVFGLPKKMPRNALISAYTHEMAVADQLLAKIFGGPGAVAAANSFEPAGLSNQYPLYRGDILGDHGNILTGHLSHAMHLYGSFDGRGETSLYIPAGFTSHSSSPTPTDAAVTFFYPRLGNFSDVTLAVFHIANFGISQESGRIKIGTVGGRGGSYAFYKHSHIEFYRGNTGLPSASARQRLRIDPAAVFGTAPTTARLRKVIPDQRTGESN
ncbi:MAG: hypothetical protein H0V18_10355 [Pyrinomonadaceae bacterium]|nr:hypothetical protein [Pyrinomonadaceae bacterium]